jgi:hypothetical protein
VDGGTVAFLGPVWVALGLTIVVCSVRSRSSERALEWGCRAVSVLWVLAGAAVNAASLLAGDTYAGFADGASTSFVREQWQSLVVPQHGFFIGLLVAFEAVAGLLVLIPGRARQLGLVALIAFTVALVSFGWGFCLWSVPMTGALVLLLRAERRRRSDVIRHRQTSTPATIGAGDRQ